MLESVAVARRAAAAISAAVHPAALPPAHSRLLARCPAPGPGMASGALVQTQRIWLLRRMGLILRFRCRPPPPGGRMRTPLTCTAA